MIVTPQNENEYATMLKLLNEGAGVMPSPQLMMCGWVQDNKLVMVVGLDSFVGKTCHIHVSMAQGFNYTPRAMLQEVFKTAFENCHMLIGVVNSKNENALKYDQHLGFVESVRFPGMHDDGGDLVVLTMSKDQCKYLEMKEAA